MIQLIRNASQQFVYLDIYDKMTNADYNPLFTFTSQESKNGHNVVPLSTDYTNKSRYVEFVFIPSTLTIPNLGIFEIGTTDYPYGMYNTTIYQNTSSSNLDPTGLTVIWNGLTNIIADSTNPAVEYTDYDTNDTDTESVYITF
jgi:hypothetical protein|tara:strand:+ start:4312 stop:4740 length:429 start_codon:yes stop_codon:yes gene_type:complete